MKFYYRRIFQHEKNKFPGIVNSIIKYKDENKYDLEKFNIQNNLNYPIDLDRYEIFIEELDRDRKILYNRLLEAMSLLEGTPIIHFTNEMKKRKIYPGDRYARLSLCLFSSVNEYISPIYLVGDTEKLFHGSNLFPLTRVKHYQSKTKTRVGRPKKNVDH